MGENLQRSRAILATDTLAEPACSKPLVSQLAVPTIITMVRRHDLFRAPLLGQWVTASQWINAAGWLLGVSLVAVGVFLVCRRRLVYWV